MIRVDADLKPWRQSDLVERQRLCAVYSAARYRSGQQHESGQTESKTAHQGISTTFPVVLRASRLQWASAASASGKVVSIRTVRVPALIQSNRSDARFSSSARSSV